MFSLFAFFNSLSLTPSERHLLFPLIVSHPYCSSILYQPQPNLDWTLHLLLPPTTHPHLTDPRTESLALHQKADPTFFLLPTVSLHTVHPTCITQLVQSEIGSFIYSICLFSEHPIPHIQHLFHNEIHTRWITNYGQSGHQFSGSSHRAHYNKQWCFSLCSRW